MASSDATEFPIKGVAWRVTFPIFDADGDTVTGATGLDSEVSKDGGAFADCTNEATEIGSSGIYYLDLTSTEMNADTVAIRVQTSTSGAKTTILVRYPLNMSEPSAAPTWNMKWERVLAWTLLRLRNKETTTDSTITVYADDGSTTVATYSRSDDGTTYTRGEAT